MKFPETKLDFLDLTAKTTVENDTLRELIAEEPYILLPFAIYSSELADILYPEEDEGRVRVSERILDHTIDDTRFEIHKRNDHEKGLRYDVRVSSLPSNRTIHRITVKTTGAAVGYILDYITNNM